MTEPTDHEMFADPSTWPQWPYLPVKRRVPASESPPEVGILINLIDVPVEPVVYLINMFTAQTLSGDTPKITYTSFDELVEAGWKVD